MQLSAMELQITASITEPNSSFKKWKSGPITMNCGQLGGTQAKPPVHPAAKPPANTSMYSSQAVSSEFWLANVNAFRRGVKMKMPNGPPKAPASTKGVSGSLTTLLRQHLPRKLRDFPSGPWKTGAELMTAAGPMPSMSYSSLALYKENLVMDLFIDSDKPTKNSTSESDLLDANGIK